MKDRHFPLQNRRKIQENCEKKTPKGLVQNGRKLKNKKITRKKLLRNFMTPLDAKSRRKNERKKDPQGTPFFFSSSWIWRRFCSGTGIFFAIFFPILRGGVSASQECFSRAFFLDLATILERASRSFFSRSFLGFRDFAEGVIFSRLFCLDFATSSLARRCNN